MKRISIVTPCFNEEANVELVQKAVADVMAKLPEYDYEHIFIDNASTDRTAELLVAMATANAKVKVILNTRNFGHIRSPYYALMQSTGDAAIFVAGDLQEPPETILEFVRKWQDGYKIVVGVKTKSRETLAMFLIRRVYYLILSRLSETPLVRDFNGFGLYDRKVLEIIRKMNDPYPYLRGLIAETGFEIARVPYTQAARLRGITSNNFYTLYDIAMLGLVNYSKVPLRLAAMLGFALGLFNLLAAIFYFSYKLLNWDSFSVGIAPVVIGMFFLGSVQLFFLGVVGEYIASIQTQVLHRPLVIEKERFNFDDSSPL